MKPLTEVGEYVLLMRRVFLKPDKPKVFNRQVLIEMDNLGLDSLPIVAIISVFVGVVIAMQTAFNIDSPLMPSYSVGFTTRQSLILEFSPTIVSLLLAGKIGSRISSEIGTMRISDQIDALEIMGINSANFLILPKIIATMIINPILVIISMFLGIFGGWVICVIKNLVTTTHYIEGIVLDFELYSVFYSLVKTIVFAFLITSVSAYYGYKVSGGALEVGRASTKAVVSSSIMIILFNVIITLLLLG